MIKKLNDKLYLSLQLYNGPDGSLNRVFVDLKDQDQNSIASDIELTHTSNGFFTESDELMPSVTALFAFFRVTEADGITISCDHAYHAQRYERDFTGELVQSLRPIAATIIGEVSNSNIVGDIQGEVNIIGEVEEIDVEGFFDDNNIDYELSGNTIIGGVQ